MGKGKRLKQEREDAAAIREEQTRRKKSKANSSEQKNAAKTASASSHARNIASKTPVMKQTTVKKASPAKKAEKPAVEEKPTKKKSILARAYDAVRPGDYTPKQDRVHAAAIALVLTVALITLGISWYVFFENQKQSVSAKLLIPSTSYSVGQVDNVVDMLGDNGFKDITVEEDGDVVAYGTPDMVEKYRQSYKERHIDTISADFDRDYSSIGVTSITLSPDNKIMTVETITADPLASSVMKQIVGESHIAKLISEYGQWCRMTNDGEAMTIRFVTGMDGQQYYESQRQNGDMIVADLEKDERAAQNENTGSEEPSEEVSSADAEQ